MTTQTRKPTEVRRREIAEAALRVIGEQGASQLTAATLAREVGLTPGALFRHYASLEDILAAAVGRAVELVEGTFPEPDSGLAPLDRLRGFVDARVRLIRSTPGLAWLLLSDQVYLTVPAEAVERLRALVQRSRAFLLDAVRAGHAAGSLRADVEPEVMLVLITGSVHALIGTSGVHRGSRPRPNSGPNSPKGSPPQPDQVLDSLFSMLTEPKS